MKLPACMFRSVCFHTTSRIRTFIVIVTTEMSVYRGNTKKYFKPKVADVLVKVIYHATLLFQILFRVHQAVKPNWLNCVILRIPGCLVAPVKLRNTEWGFCHLNLGSHRLKPVFGPPIRPPVSCCCLHSFYRITSLFSSCRLCALLLEGKASVFSKPGSMC